MRQEKRSTRAIALTTSGAATLAVAIAGLMGQAAHAQQDDDSDVMERMVVTGSRILRQDMVANSPIVTVDSDLLENQTGISVETALNQLPQFIPALTEHDSRPLAASANTTPGASTVSLRGLGSQRTLTLIDGRRGMPINATLAVDTNMIPSSAVQRVEIISGGASAVYGADAVAGVVNFILKDNYEGFDVTARYGMTEEGDGEQSQISALLGLNLADGRGNIMFGMEHADRSPSYMINRRWERARLVDPAVRGTEFAPLTAPYIIFPAGNQPTQGQVDQIFTGLPPCTLPGNGNPCPTPNPSSHFFVSPSADGNGQLFTGAPSFAGTVANAGAARYTGPLMDPATGLPYRKFNTDGVLSQNNLDTLTSLPMTRYSLFSKGEFALSDSTSVYMQANYANTESETTTSYASAIAGWSATVPHGTERTTVNNFAGMGVDGVTGDIWGGSFLNPQMRTALNPGGALLGYMPSGAPVWDPMAATNPDFLPGGGYGLNVQPGIAALGTADLTCGPIGGCSQSYVFPMPAEMRALLEDRPDPNADIELAYPLEFVGRRGTANRVNTYQLVLGLEGELNNSWLWDASVSHGASETTTFYRGSPKLRQYIDLMQSPNYGVNFHATGIDEAAAGAGRCTTGLPVWRDFEVSQDCRETLLADMQFTSQVVMDTAEANVAGGLLNMPAGELAFSAGVGYRSFDYESTVDPLNDVFTYTEEVIGQRAQEATRGKISVRELYGELLIPLLNNRPFVQQLDLEIGGRLSDYNTSGTVDTYKALLDWSINDWARLRGGYNRATRAPHIGELYQGQTNGFFGTMTDGDPCSRNNDLPTYGAGLGNPDPASREAVVQLCRDMMTAAGQWNFYDSRTVADEPARPGQQPAARANAVVLFGNRNIQPETADTWTAGLVLTSPFRNAWAENLALTIDWYSIEITDIIAQQNVAEQWRQCMLTLDANSVECSLVHRDAVDGGAVQTDITYSNQGYARFSGVDVQVNWQAQLEDIGLGFIPGRLTINSHLTVPHRRITQANPNAQRVENVGTLRCDLQLNCSGYDYSVFTTFGWSLGDINIGLRWNHYPEIDAVSVATNPASRDRGVFESYNLFSLNASYDLNDRFTLRGGIDNLFDTSPPLSGGSYAAGGGWVGAVAPAFPTQPAYSSNATYDQFGRRFFIGATVSL